VIPGTRALAPRRERASCRRDPPQPGAPIGAWRRPAWDVWLSAGPHFLVTRGLTQTPLVPPPVSHFAIVRRVGSWVEFLFGVDDLGWGFALVPFPSVGSTVVVVGEVVGEVAS